MPPGGFFLLPEEKSAYRAWEKLVTAGEKKDLTGRLEKVLTLPRKESLKFTVANHLFFGCES